jgi:hypothetical protein
MIFEIFLPKRLAINGQVFLTKLLLFGS